MQTTLYCQQGNSDKVYIIEKVAAHGGFMINFAYGRRGSTLNTGSKTVSPVSETKAQEIFAKLRGEKIAKGYFEGAPLAGYTYAVSNTNVVAFPAANAASSANQASQATGINVQLLTAVEDNELEALFKDENVVAQEKFDGKRIALVLDKGDIYGVNRTGLRCGIPNTFADSIKKVVELCREVFNTSIEQMIVDGEGIGDNYFAFDLLELNGVDFRSQTYTNRYQRLKTILYAGRITKPSANLFCSEMIRGEAAKRAFFAAAKAKNLEGVVFKNGTAPYEAGRPNSGGNQRKYKFCAEATCLVSGQNGAKRSVSLQVLNADGSFRDIGNCTIPANFDVPQYGMLVEIRYLYAYFDGSLYQPVYKGERGDKTAPDEYNSLKFKAPVAAAA